MTVTDCAMFQSAGVKVSVELDTVPADGSPETTSSTTVPAGALDRVTESVAEPPASVVVVPAGVLTTMLAVSSSTLSNARAGTGSPSYRASLLATVTRSSNARVPSSAASSTPVTKTDWARFQLVVVKTRLLAERLPSPGSETPSASVTVPVGGASSRNETICVSVPASSVSEPVRVTVTPGDTSATVRIETPVGSAADSPSQVTRIVPPAAAVTDGLRWSPGVWRLIRWDGPSALPDASNSRARTSVPTVPPPPEACHATTTPPPGSAATDGSVAVRATSSSTSTTPERMPVTASTIRRPTAPEPMLP